jgi:hypothetical protein
MENTSMNSRSSRSQWALALLALASMAILAVLAYNAGMAEGAAQLPPVAGNVTPPPYAYGWHRPWGLFPFFPFLFLFFWFFVARAFWWGWGPRRYWHHGYGPDDRERFDEWHRRAHDQMKG